MYNVVNTYKKIYKLKKIKTKLLKDNSIGFIFFDNNGNYYIVKNNLIEYSSLLSLNIISIISNIEKIYKIKIYNYFPLCFINENSMLFACKIKRPSECLVKYKKDNDEINEFIDLIKKEIKFYSDDYDDERLLLEKYSNRYRVYQNVIKKYFLTEKRRRKKEYLDLLKTLIGDSVNSIVDVSCGDNADIFKISNKIDLVVGNDINLYHVRNNQFRFKNIIFTNDNLLNLKYEKEIFDVSYCKNTLHHLNGNEELNEALESLYKISKKIIIVEIEDPKIVGGMSKFLNKYLYIKYLKDAGKKFLSFYKFKTTIDTKFSDKANISYLTFENILGKYMIAIIEKR